MANYDQRQEFGSHSLDKQKYFAILKTQGLSAALTELHREKEQLEFVTFEGANGYQPELYELVQQYCDFSRELWDTSLQ